MSRKIKPNNGPQEGFLGCQADIVIYGGAAGGGKTFGIVMDPVRFIRVPGFNAVIFRRTSPEITNPGGLWDESHKLYHLVGGTPKESSLLWKWGRSNAVIKFGHMQYENDVQAWHGSQICMLGFDELTTFTKRQFFYMLSRNRSTCGVQPYVRATCNPDPDSWVREFISWWIDEATGYPIPERDGVVRWFVRRGDEIEWYSDREQCKGDMPKSCTFISANIYDNPPLLETNPEYEANLKSLPAHERARLLGGNWNARAFEGSYFKREFFEIVDQAPPAGRSVRWWDRAATKPTENNPNPDWTVGLRARKCHDGYMYIEDVKRFRERAGERDRLIQNTASQEPGTRILLAEDPGQAGKVEAHALVKKLAGYDVRTIREMESKEVRAVPVSSAAQNGMIKVVRGPWNEKFFSELESFPSKGAKKDQVDSLTGAYRHLYVDGAEPSVYIV